MNMKNHIWQNEQLLQTNKKWSALKQSQRTWIHEVTAKKHSEHIEKYGKLPTKKQKEEVLDNVHEHITERNIWIPYNEFHLHVSVMIDKLNRKNPLYKSSTKESEPKNPKTPRAGIEEFPENIQSETNEKMTKFIQSYVTQMGRAPSDKIREGHIKNILRGFNAKKWKSYGKKMVKSDTLLNMYNELRKNIEIDG